MKHEGFSRDRLKPEMNNPREVAFAAQWEYENKDAPGGRLMHHLIPDFTERDATVAATVIQWLGSNVGTGFLIEVLRREPSLRKRLSL